ncbi:hypothetical protein [Lactococcus kimchii]|uniref:hypothetical protein n=1 Tax=Lactococcus sp. S-13 TaxID=2507158 RepID=UPI001022D8D2|nr:hypothetical protein [Lactococcus sp. S-13]RZI49340.1 hypothetical protein EQJ87_07745 [Lactococcus sp. S-13]
MKFKFKGIAAYEETENNYIGANRDFSLVKEFDSFESAIDYVAAHKGFLLSEDGKSAFNVLTISEIN